MVKNENFWKNLQQRIWANNMQLAFLDMKQ